MATIILTIKEAHEEIERLILKRVKLQNKALKTFPNSPKQLKLLAEVEELRLKIIELNLKY